MIDLEGLTPKQIKVIRESDARINLTDGAVRAGKTVGFNLRWLEYVLNSGPPGDLMMIGKTERALKRNILNPMHALLGDDYMKISTGASEVYIGGRKIYTVGANDERAVGKIQGSTLAGAYGDEVGLWPESFFSMLLSRLSVKGSKLFGTTNPEGPYHWLKKNYIDRRHHLNLRRWHFHIDDNTFLDPDYVESLKAEYTGVFYSRYIRGLWVLAEGLVYQVPPTYGRVRDPLAFDSFIVSADYGTSNPTTFGLYGFDKGKPPVYLVREYYYDGGQENTPQKTDSEYADDMERFIEPVKSKIKNIYIDPSALSFITELKKRKGMPQIKQAKNDVLPGIRFTAGLINRKLFLVDSSCEHTKKGYASYVWDEKAQERGEDKPLKKDDHVCVTGDTLVHTTEGPKPIASLIGKTGHMHCLNTEDLTTHVREFNTVRLTRKKAKILVIKLEDGREIKLTENHKVFTNNGWKRAKDLTDRDFIIEISIPS